MKCTKSEEENGEDRPDYSFDLWATPDAWPYMTDSNIGGAGFFFALSGFPPEITPKNPKKVRFHIKNLSA